MSEPLQWKDDYSVGVEVLDRQHRGLIQLINRLGSDETTADTITRVFEELEAYTKEHFAHEEALMKAADYGDFKAHRQQHKAFEQWLSAVRQSSSMGVTSPSLLIETIDAFLRDWLVNHILSSDMAYKDALKTDEQAD